MEITMDYLSGFDFDIVGYIKKLRDVGVKQEVAEVQAQGLFNVVKTSAQAINEIRHELHPDDLATKGDIQSVKAEIQSVKAELQTTKSGLQAEIRESELRLQKEIKELEVKLIKWLLSVGITASLAVCGATFTMFKTFIH